MTPVKPPKGNFRFRIIGGGLQLRIENADDLASILDLDEALWAMTSVDIDYLRFDRKFLEFIDSDHDGQIRSDEIKQAVKFTLSHFSDLSGVLSGKNELTAGAINTEIPGGKECVDCAGLLLRNLNLPADGGLTVENIRNDKSISCSAIRNGDGVICIDSELPSDLSFLIGLIIASGRKTLDRSGNFGVSLSDVENFEAALARRLELLDTRENDPAISVYGDQTAAGYLLFKECEELLDSFFLNSAAGRFLFADPARPEKKELSADLIVSGNVRQALENAAAAIPAIDGGLDFSKPLNPLYAGKLQQLAASCVLEKFLNGSILSEENYRQAKAALAPYGAWKSAVETADGLETLAVADLRSLQKETFAALKELIAADLSFAPVISSGETLLKMALFQNYLVEFLNNSVSLSNLFNPRTPSRLQMGKLVMDGRHFTLAVRVKNAAEHKRIIKSSNICVIYVEITRQCDGKSDKQLLAVAVTGGTMRSLFIGKHGVFFDQDGVIYDAVIKDIVEQPVSIGEAFKAPFFQFADFLSKQTERIFNTRNAEMQKSMTTELNKSQLAAVPPKPGTPAPAATPAAASGMGNLPMLLMGGGIGVAALGSSIAFIAKSLQNVSFTTILAVLGGIIVIFGGPSIINALIKLFRRDLSRFLESCGCAINRPMRMSRKMGAIFTFVPKRPRGHISVIDPAETFAPVTSGKRWKIWLFILLLAIVCGAGAWFFHFRKNCGKAEVVPVKKECKKVEKPLDNNTKPAVPAQNKPAAENPKKGDKKNAGPVA